MKAHGSSINMDALFCMDITDITVLGFPGRLFIPKGISFMSRCRHFSLAGARTSDSFH